jgi:hypothetical protein
MLLAYQTLSARLLLMSQRLNDFNNQFEGGQFFANLPIQLRVSGNLWWVEDFGLDTSWRGAITYNQLQPAMTSAQCDTLAQAMIAAIILAYPNV